MRRADKKAKLSVKQARKNKPCAKNGQSLAD